MALDITWNARACDFQCQVLRSSRKTKVDGFHVSFGLLPDERSNEMAGEEFAVLSVHSGWI